MGSFFRFASGPLVRNVAKWKGTTTMQTRIIGCLLVSAVIAAASGCAALSGLGDEGNASDWQVPLSSIPAPARITIEKLTAGGEIEKIEQEEAGGRVIYDVEARVDGKDVEYDVASDGTVLTIEESVSYDSLPEAVKAASRKYFGTEAGLRASKEVEEDKTFYEVEGNKGNAVVTLKLTDTGRIIEKKRSDRPVRRPLSATSQTV
jgi:uncharacterized membrane protein YkoI